MAPPTAILGAPTIVSRVSFDIRVTAENSPLIFQKILRSVTFTSIRKLNQPTPVILFVADEARFLASWTFTVFVVPPETSRSLGFNDLTSMSWRGARSSTTPSSSSAPAAAAATAAVTAALHHRGTTSDKNEAPPLAPRTSSPIVQHDERFGGITAAASSSEFSTPATRQVESQP